MSWYFALAGAAALLLWIVWRRVRRRAPFASGRPFATEFVEVGRWRIRVHRAGSGPFVLLIHGLGANLHCWRALIETLGDRYCLLAPDLPGFGQSTIHEDEGYGLDDQVQRLVELLDRLKIRRCHVVGNSMGGNIALWLAKSHPKRVQTVSVIAPAASPRLVPLGLGAFHWAANPLSLLASRDALDWIHQRVVSRPGLFSAERIEESFQTYGRQGAAVRALMKATDAIRDPRLPTALAGLTTPTLILWGSRDRLVSRKVIDGLERVLPEARSFVHLGGGHHLQEDNPEWTAEKLTRFFGEFQD